MTLHDVGELGLVKSLLPYLSAAGGELLVGPGQDDAAAWREADGSVTVATCDAAVEGVHFDFGWLTAREVGWRALALALGDLAAKGARPTYGLASVSAPAGFQQVRLLELYEGMAQVASRTGLKLVGGDFLGLGGVLREDRSQAERQPAHQGKSDDKPARANRDAMPHRCESLVV